MTALREDVADRIGYVMAALVSGNRMPCMSGDPRDRLSPLVRRQFDDACREAADAVIPIIIERAATSVERRMEARFAEHGTTEPDTNASYYSGRYGETLETLDEEDEAIAAAIRQIGRPE